MFKNIYLPIFLLLCVNINAQTKLSMGTTTKNEFDADMLVKTADGNYMGFSEGKSSDASYSYLFDKKLKNSDRKLLDHDGSSHIGFYSGKEQTVQYCEARGKITKLTYTNGKRKIEESKVKVDGVVPAHFCITGHWLYDINTSHSPAVTYTGKSWFTGSRYDIRTDEKDLGIEDKDNKSRAGTHGAQKLFALLNGNILLFDAMDFSNGIGGLPEVDGFEMKLYDSELNIITKQQVKRKLFYNTSNAFSLENNSNDLSNLYFWARDQKTNKMFIYKINIKDNDVSIIENEIKGKDIETIFINKAIDKKSYNEVFKQLVTDMAEDKSKKTQGNDYVLDSSITLGDMTYINYHLVQNISGKDDGSVIMFGVFVLDEKGEITRNMVVGYDFVASDKKKIHIVGYFNQLQYFNLSNKLHAFPGDNKINYFYTQDSKLKGFELKEGGELTALDEINLVAPESNKGESPTNIYSIIPLSKNSLVVKARQTKTYTENGMGYIYLKCDYTLFDLE